MLYTKDKCRKQLCWHIINNSSKNETKIDLADELCPKYVDLNLKISIYVLEPWEANCSLIL